MTLSLYHHLLGGRGRHEDIVPAEYVEASPAWRERLDRLPPGARLLVLAASRPWGDARRVRVITSRLEQTGLRVEDVFWVGTSTEAPQLAVPYGDHAALRWLMSHGFVPCTRRGAVAASLLSRRLGSFAVPLAFPAIAFSCRRGPEVGR